MRRPVRVGFGPFGVPRRGLPAWRGREVVVGSGNPGEQYAKTRHNVGWMTLDRLADRAGWAGRGRTRDASSVVQGRYRGLDLVLAKPLTFMNDSASPCAS